MSEYTTDLPKLLRRFSGSQERLLRFVNGFLRDFSDMPERFDALERQGNTSEIAEFAHRVKGVVGYVEADALFAMSGQVEHAARQGDLAGVRADKAAFLKLMRDCVDKLSALAQEYGQDRASEPKGAALSKSQALEEISALMQLIESGDFAARARLDRLSEGLQKPHWRNFVKTALDNFDELNLSEAIGALQSLQREIEDSKGFA